MNSIKPNILHIRPLPFSEDGTAPTGGITVAYYLREHKGNVVAVCGISLCSFHDNFNKKEGRNRAEGRLQSVLDYPIELHKNLGMVQYISIGSVAEIQEATKDSIGLQKFVEALAVDDKNKEPIVTTVPFDGEAGAFLFLREDDWPILDSLKETIVGNLMEYRKATYNGNDEYVFDDIHEMIVDYLGDDQVDDEDYEEYEDEEGYEDDYGSEDKEFKLP